MAFGVLVESNTPMKSPLVRTAVVLSLFSTLSAETLVQPQTYATSNEGNLYQGDGSQILADSTFFYASVQPFDESLGTLVSFTIQCRIQGELNGSVLMDAPGGSASGGMGGTFYLGGLAFDGTGGSNGTGGPGGAPLEATFSIPDYERTLLVSEAGMAYNPALLDFVTGDATFDLSYESAVTISHSSVQDLFASVEGSLTLIYTYTTPGGETATLKVVGIVRDSDTGDVTVEWTSEPAKTYRVEAGESPDPASLSTIAPTVPAGSGETTTYTESVPPTTPRRFYRIHEND
jgi:hypothetical protein